MQTRTHPDTSQLLGALLFLVLFAGIGRMYSLVLHDPLIGYANNYEMIPLQACHQIWPAGKDVDITRGTPAAPLHDYTLDKHVDTNCVPGSELLFTSLGIAYAGLKNSFSGADTISIRDIGVIEALLLSLVALAAQLYFHARRHTLAMTVHAFAVLLILSDPGITLYLNTFYSEFAAVAFLYLAMLGMAILAVEQWSLRGWRMLYCLPLLVGLLGFGFSRPQHLYFLSWFGLLPVLWLFLTRRRWLALAVAICSVAPFATQAAGLFNISNANLELASKVNVMGSALGTGKDSSNLLYYLDLPDSCQDLAGKSWYHAVVQQNKTCFELADYSHSEIAFSLLGYPSITAAMFHRGLPQLKEWVIRMYGHVEQERLGNVQMYYWSFNSVTRSFSDGAAAFLMLAPVAVFALLTLAAAFGITGFPTARAGLLLMLSLLPVAIYSHALLMSGFVDLAKNIHLVTPLLMFQYLLCVALLVDAGIKRLFSQ